MNLLTISNLYPRPDRPQAGMFNAQLFREMGRLVSAAPARGSLRNVCLVPEWRLWRWPAIRRWSPLAADEAATRYLPVFYVPRFGRNWNAATYARSLAALDPLLRAADRAFVSWLYPDAVAVARRAAPLGIPLWAMALGTDTQHLAVASRRAHVLGAAAATAGYICVSPILADRLTQAGLPAAHTHVIPNGVDATVFHYRTPPDAWSRLRATSSTARRLADAAAVTRTLLFVGNLVAIKAPDVLLDSFALAQRNRSANEPRLRLVLIGVGPLESRLRRQAERLGVTADVTFAGSRAHAEIALWMNATDVLCLSSRSEGMPNVILEALASGLPVISTNVGDCPNMLRGESASRVVGVDRPDELAAAVAAILRLPQDRAALAARHGRRSWRDQAREIVALMQAQEASPT